MMIYKKLEGRGLGSSCFDGGGCQGIVAEPFRPSV